MKGHIFFILIIIASTFVAWYKILFQMFLGEGYYYFGKSFFIDLSPADKIVRYDKGTFLLFQLLSELFKDNIFLYQLFALGTLLVLTVLLYILIYEISRKKLIAFIATLLFGVSYNGNFQMFAIGNYQFFVQRVVFFLLLIPSTFFLVSYLKNKKEKYFLLSVFFYFLSLYLAKFSIFFLPFLISYILVFAFLKSKRNTEKIFFIFRALLYLIPTIGFLQLESQRGSSFLLHDKNFLNFLISERNIIIDQLLRQLTSLLIPPQVNKFLLDFLQSQSSKNAIQSLYLPVFISFMTIVFYIIKRNTAGRVAIISAVMFIPMVFILNIFTRGDNYIASITPGDRYLFVPLIGASIIFSYFFYSLFSYRGIGSKIAVIIVIIFLTYTNIRTIWTRIDSGLSEHIAAKKSIKFIKQLSPSFSSDSFIILPSVMGYFGANFSQIYFGKENTTFTPFFSNWDQDMKRPFDPKKDFIIRYDYINKEAMNVTNNYKTIFEQRLKKRIDNATNLYDDNKPL